MEIEDAQPDDDDEEQRAGEAAERERQARKRSGGGGSVAALGAAMLAVGEILEPEKTAVEIVQTNDDPIDDPPFDLDFGDLPPLD